MSTFKTCFPILYFSCAVSVCYGQIPCADFTINKWYSELYATSIYGYEPLVDGNFIICGNYYLNYDDQRGMLIKMNADGEILWQNVVLQDNSNETIYCATELPDGSFVVAGVMRFLSGNDTTGHCYLAKYNSAGLILWERYFDPPSLQEGFFDITLCPNGELGLLANILYDSYYAAWVLRLDSNGNILWEREFGKSANVWSHSGFQVLSTDQDNFLIVTELRAVNSSYTDTRIFQLSPTGSTLKEIILGSPYGRLVRMISDPSGGYIATGKFHNDVWVVRLNDDLSIQWEKTFGGTQYDAGRHLCVNPNGGYFIAAETMSSDGDVCFHAGDGDYWILSLNNSGQLAWQKTLGGSSVDRPDGIQAFADGFFVIGETRSNDGDAADIPNINLNATPNWFIRLHHLRYEYLNLGPRDTSLCLGAPLILKSNSSDCIMQTLWNTGEYGLELVANTQAIYWGEIQQGLCKSRDSITIHYAPCSNEPCLIYPNAITPDGDDINESFRPIHLCGDLLMISFRIYNRWGELIYSADNLDTDGWNGRLKDGQEAPADVYIWHCIYEIDTDEKKGIKSATGEITLLR